MPEKSSENREKRAKKLLKNELNPHGMGVLRFSMLEILFCAALPMTITEIETKLCELHGQVNRRWLRKVMGEMQQISGRGIAIQVTEKRVGDTKAPAYYINKPNPQQHV